MPVNVLDAYALMAFFEDEPGGKEVEKLIAKATSGQLSLLISVVNLGEVWYSVARGYSTAAADQTVQTIEGLPIDVVPADWEVTHLAAQFKAEGKLSYGDCFAAALAKLKDAELVTGDKEFVPLERAIKIQWL